MDKLPVSRIENDFHGDLAAKRAASADRIIDFGSEPRGDIKAEASVFEGEKREKIHAKVAEALRKRYDDMLKHYEDMIKKGGNSILEELVYRFNIVDKYGVDIATNYLVALQEPDISDESLDQKIEDCVSSMYMGTGSTGSFIENSYSIIVHNLRHDGKVSKAILKSFGINTTQPGKQDAVNECDQLDLLDGVRMKYLASKDRCDKIFKNLFRDHPEEVKKFLATGDQEGILKVIQEEITPEFREILERMTVDTAERVGRRKKFIIGREVNRIIGTEALLDDKTIRPFIQETVDEYTYLKNFKPEASDSDFVIKQMKDNDPYGRIEKIVEYIYDHHPDFLTLDGKNYVLKNKDIADLAIADAVKTEIREILDRRFSQWKREKKVEISWTPEQQGVIEAIKQAAVGFYAQKREESKSWEGFSDEDRKNMLEILMNGALRVQYEKRILSLGAPNDEKVIQKYVEDIMKTII